MKKGQHESEEAKCPFYKKESDNCQNYCEGIYENWTLMSNCPSDDKETCRIHRESFCYSYNYFKCPIARMLEKINAGEW